MALSTATTSPTSPLSASKPSLSVVATIVAFFAVFINSLRGRPSASTEVAVAADAASNEDPAATTATIPAAADPADLPPLTSTTPLTYLAEGAANVIFRLPEPSRYLLRLRKTLPSAQPNEKAYIYLSSTAFPLFPPHLLIATSLVLLPDGLLARENTALRAHEVDGKRPRKRHNMYLEEAGERYGFLVADMSPHTPRQLLVEFKPKWVVQSPSAPADARRCRTCALRLKKGGGTGFCPLDLASGDAARVRRAVAQLLPRRQPHGFAAAGKSWEALCTELGEVVVQFLVCSELMDVLKRLQRELDPLPPRRHGRPVYGRHDGARLDGLFAHRHGHARGGLRHRRSGHEDLRGRQGRVLAKHRAGAARGRVVSRRRGRVGLPALGSLFLSF